jgi:ABC-type multidrug transport system fused ATPase/permease subunit
VAVVSVLPIAMLLLVGGLLLSYNVAAWRMFSASGRAARPCAVPAAPPPATAAVKGASAAPLDQTPLQITTHETGLPAAFVFDGISCSVPARRAAGPARSFAAVAASRCAALRRQTGNDNSAGTAVDQDSPEAAAPQQRASEAAAAGRKVLLRNISGTVEEGDVLGVLGPSGAGKSTLLSILSGATESVGTGARVEGSVTLGGEARRSVLRKVTAFVPQKDVLLPALTVEECVRYSALLRLPRSLGAEDIQVCPWGRRAAFSKISTCFETWKPSSKACMRQQRLNGLDPYLKRLLCISHPF